MDERIKKILCELKRGLSVLYGDRFSAVCLYGSYARREETDESDLDVLIVLDQVPDYSREIDHTSELISRLSLEHGISISRVFCSEEQWREDQTLFFQNVREEAVFV